MTEILKLSHNRINCRVWLAEIASNHPRQDV